LTNDHLVPLTIKKIHATHGKGLADLAVDTEGSVTSSPLPRASDLSHSCFQAVLYIHILERQANGDKKTEYHLKTSDTPGASTGTSSPTGTFLSCSFPVINHLQMLPQQHSCGRLSTSAWIPFSSVTRARKKASLKFWRGSD